MQNNPATTDLQRSALGITVPGSDPTPDTRARPANARGVEIWRNVGPPIATAAEMAMIAFHTATPYLAVFDAEDSGKTAYYALRGISKDDQSGPWNEIVSATIGL